MMREIIPLRYKWKVGGAENVAREYNKLYFFLIPAFYVNFKKVSAEKNSGFKLVPLVLGSKERKAADLCLPDMHLSEQFCRILLANTADRSTDLLSRSRRQHRRCTVCVASQHEIAVVQGKSMAPINFNGSLLFLHRWWLRLARCGSLEGILFRGLQHPSISVFCAEKDKNAQFTTDFLQVLRGLLNFLNFV